MKKLTSLLLTGALALGLLAGCSSAPTGGDTGTPQSSAPAQSSESAQPSASTPAEGTTITVAASPTPHAEILKVAKEVLAQQGITLEIKEITDYICPTAPRWACPTTPPTRAAPCSCSSRRASSP